MLLLGDCNNWLKEIKDNSIDLLLTDPPYGLEFMGKDWDRVVIPTETWKECYRVLKQGKLAFVMCSPRQDVLSRMIINLQDAGFRTNYTSIYWTFASGFPKAANISKLIDKRGGADLERFYKIVKKRMRELGLSMKDLSKYFPSKTGGITGCVYNWFEYKISVPTVEEYNKLVQILKLEGYPELKEAEREIIGKQKQKGNIGFENEDYHYEPKERLITKPATEAAKAMEGAYVGFQPKPAVEVILVVSKGKTISWLDDCRIPYQSEDDKQSLVEKNPHTVMAHNDVYGDHTMCKEIPDKGRFPANLICQDDILNDGRITKSTPASFQNTKNILDPNTGWNNNSLKRLPPSGYNDEGSYSRYFSLDQWWAKTFPFLVVAKASKSEKGDFNSHPTVKSLKLMSYLITMGSREGDLVLDPFCGSGTVCIAAHQLHRKWLGIEMNPEYAEIIKKRLADPLAQLKLTSYLENEVPQT